MGLKANLGLGMDLTLNIYPEVRIGLKPNLRQIEFRFFCRFVIFQPVANIGSTQSLPAIATRCNPEFRGSRSPGIIHCNALMRVFIVIMMSHLLSRPMIDFVESL